MEIKVENLEKNNYKVTLSFNKEEWDNAVKESYEHNKGKFNIPGFRKGKAPQKVIEKNYGDGVFYDDAIDHLFEQGYKKALEDHKELDPIDNPSLEIKSFDEKGLVMEAKVVSMPEVKLGEYKGLKVEKEVKKVEDKDVEEDINGSLERRAKWVKKESTVAEMGDTAVIDFVGSVDGEKFEGGSSNNYKLVLGSKSFIDNFEEQVVGMNVGETKDVVVTFPEEYPAENLKGKKAVFEVTLNELDTKVLPELNDEFASEYTEFNTLEEYKNSVREKLQKKLDEEAERIVENKLVAKIADNAEVEIPNVLIERQLDLFMRDIENRLKYQGVTLEDYCKLTNNTVKAIRDERYNDAKQTTKIRLVMEEIIRKENLYVTKEELDEKLAILASKLNKTKEEYLKLINNQQISYLENELLVNKVLEFLKQNNQIV